MRCRKDSISGYMTRLNLKTWSGTATKDNFTPLSPQIGGLFTTLFLCLFVILLVFFVSSAHVIVKHGIFSRPCFLIDIQDIKILAYYLLMYKSAYFA